MELLGNVLKTQQGRYSLPLNNNQYYLMLMTCTGQKQAEKALKE